MIALALTPDDRRKLELAGLILPPTPAPVNKGGRPRKLFIVAPVPSGPTFKTTPGPRDGVRYKSPYRHMAGRATNAN